MPRLLLVLLGVLSFAIVAGACGGDDDADDLATNTPRERSTRTATPTDEPEATETPEPSATAAASATTGPTSAPPAPFVAFPARRADGVRQEDACGDFTVVRDGTPFGTGLQQESVAVLNAAGDQILDVRALDPGSSVGVDWCYDLDVDGVMELAIFSYSGGAHCCVLQTIFSFGSGTAVPAFQFDAGNAGGLVPREIDGNAPIELLGLDDRLAYYDNLPFAISPVVPIVYAFRDGAWVEATRDFRPVVDQHRRQLAVELSATCTEEQEFLIECEKGFSLGIMADSLMLGDWDQFREQLSLGPDVWAWLAANESAVEELFSRPRQ